MSFKRLWLAEAVHRVTDMRQRELCLWWKQRALVGPEDSRNNSLFIKHLLCTRHGSKFKPTEFHPPTTVRWEQLPSRFAEEAA